jgi:hypothetical protein
MPSRLVSYGKFLALDFAFLARRRRTSSEEILNLRAVLGPCDGSHPYVCVVTAPPAPLPCLPRRLVRRRPGEGGSLAMAGPRRFTVSNCRRQAALPAGRQARRHEHVSFRQVPSAGRPRIRALPKLPPSQRPQNQSDLCRSGQSAGLTPPRQPSGDSPRLPRPPEVRTSRPTVSPGHQKSEHRGPTPRPGPAAFPVRPAP